MYYVMINYTIFMHTLANGWLPGTVSMLHPLLFFFLLLFTSMLHILSLEHKNDDDGYNPRNKAKGYL